MITPVQKAIEIAGSQQALATACGVSQAAVSKWALGGGISVESAINISQATSGRVSVADLRPDILDGLKLALKDLA
jgi:DNA-binding transcriptional regulator YdaS (Cro superfamily)